MEKRKSLASGWETRLARLPSPVLVVIGPLLGFVYITLLPTVTVVTFILTGGYYLFHRLAAKQPAPVKPAFPR